MPKWFHRHRWVISHRFGYQEDVRVLRCLICDKLHNHGVLGEHGVIPVGFSHRTGRVIFGGYHDA